MKIAFVGTRGIPNHYGGFEQFADILSQGLAKEGLDITVYCSKNHPYKESSYKGVKLIHKFDPENKIGTVGQFIYDLLCMLDAKKRGFDIIYMLGYTSSSVWQRLIFNGKSRIITNMDGLEWKRSKYSKPVQKFLLWAEKLAVKYSHELVADSIGIQKYLAEKYDVKSSYFPYGSYVFDEENVSSIEKYDLTAFQYDILIARFEPENNIEMVLDAFHKSKVKRDFILIGKWEHTEFGKLINERFKEDKRIKFLGAIYDQELLNNLRHFSNIYFHGHSVGGTNPSLLEAMGSSSLICYHDNPFNKAIVGDDGFAFSDSKELTHFIETLDKKECFNHIDRNKQKIKEIYAWQIIIDDYKVFFKKLL